MRDLAVELGTLDRRGMGSRNTRRVDIRRDNSKTAETEECHKVQLLIVTE